jgi:hypothetical protein
MFVWFYTDKFARRAVFRQLIKTRSSNFRTFLNFCTTLETYIPVILYRFHFVDNMRNSFYALDAGLVYQNGNRVINRASTLKLGDFLEIFNDDIFKILGFSQLIRCLPTLRFRLTLKDSIVNTAIFYSLFVKNYAFFALSSKYVLSTFDFQHALVGTKYFNGHHVETSFLSFLISRIFLALFRFNPLLRLWSFQSIVLESKVSPQYTRKLLVSDFESTQFVRSVGHLWWHAPIWVGFGGALSFHGLETINQNALLFPENNQLFGQMKALERDFANVPSYLKNVASSYYAFYDGALVLR